MDLVTAASGLTDAEFNTFMMIGAGFLLGLIVIGRLFGAAEEEDGDEPSETSARRR